MSTYKEEYDLVETLKDDLEGFREKLFMRPLSEQFVKPKREIREGPNLIGSYTLHDSPNGKEYTSPEKLAETIEEYGEEGAATMWGTAEHSNFYCPPNMEVDDLTNQSLIGLIKPLMEVYPKSTIRNSGFFLYKGPGAFMGWHTNSNAPTKRLYVTYCPKEGNKSFFRYRDPETKEIITSEDPKGWHIRSFEVSREKPVWHCVYSDTWRFSWGFRVIPYDS